MNQWPTAVAKAITLKQMHSSTKLSRLEASRRRIAVTSNSKAIKKHAMLITESERVTIKPAISLAFARPNDRKTPKAAGATTAPKKSAAPNQQASKASREALIKLIDDCSQTDLRRNDLRHRQLSRVRRC